MKFNEQWLREWVNPDVDTAALAHQLTMAGLEVDALEPVAGEFSDVVVAEIRSVAPHPDADRLQVCEVIAGSGATLQIVCGAPNARAGLKTALARVGARLPGGLDIRRSEVRGVESSGMLCAAAELGMAEKSSGLLELPDDAAPGTPLREYLHLDDTVIELGLTPNRADCLGIVGIAREVGVLNRQLVRELLPENIPAEHDDALGVSLEAAERCPRYVGRIIRDIDISRPSPLWLQEKLRRCGLRSIDAVVDVTNWVLLELGQPMHAFDLDKLEGAVCVRSARDGEKLRLLDEQELTLGTGDLVIADDSRALALAGIMGGADSAVGKDTRNLFLESAFFAPQHLAGRARAHGLHTDSSHRFERGVDFQGQRAAIERVTALLLEIVGGRAGPVVEACEESALPQPRPIALRRHRIERVLGVAIDDAEVEDVLTRLGLTLDSTQEGWDALPPSWRFDLELEVDLLEELARIHGYETLPVTTLNSAVSLRPQPEARQPLQRFRELLVARGYQEAITYSFIDPALQRDLDPDLTPIELANPISSDMAVMRSSLIGGLLQAARHNLNRQQSRVRLFEAGLRFLPDAEQHRQQPMLAALLTGRRYPEGWSESGESVNFYDLKGDLEAILELGCGAAAVTFEATQFPALHPGQSARLLLHGAQIGVIGAVHPQLTEKWGIDQPCFVFEVELEKIAQHSLPEFRQLSKFPEVRRDLAFVVDKSVAASQLSGSIRVAAGKTLANLRLFDTYEGKGIDPQRKSLTFGLTFQDSSRTLTEEEVNTAVNQVVDVLAADFGATLRN